MISDGRPRLSAPVQSDPIAGPCPCGGADARTNAAARRGRPARPPPRPRARGAHGPEQGPAGNLPGPPRRPGGPAPRQTARSGADPQPCAPPDVGSTPALPAATVPEALRLLAADLPDATLLDLNLGGASAAPVAEALTAGGRPFVTVTAY